MTILRTSSSNALLSMIGGRNPFGDPVFDVEILTEDGWSVFTTLPLNLSMPLSNTPSQSCLHYTNVRIILDIFMFCTTYLF